MRSANHFVFLTTFAASVWTSQAAEISAEGRDYFEAKIRPVLVAECYDCHAGSKKKGGLALDSRDGLLKGGSTGPGLVPGDAAGSLLIQTLQHSHQDVDMHMPKDGAKLDETIVRQFIAWVNMGAPDPRDTAATAEGSPSVSWEQIFSLRRQWWSLQPVKTQVVPPTGTPASHPIDRFIQATLKDKRLTPAPLAERRVLIRRLSYALTGLPPKPEEVTAFLKDESPQAWEKLVDYYLASSSYGETWARHWMDLMRYAETHGSEGDPQIPGAWRYRDYLIRAFNEDIPYNRFVQEHIAGDMLEPRWNDALGLNEARLATANLRLMEHGFQPVDSLDEQVKTVDNQIDVLTKSFLGLTVSCARCHDHKFDAISQNDFYALYGIFASTRPAQLALDSPSLLELHKEELSRLKGQIKSALAAEWLKAAAELPAQLLKPVENPLARQQDLENRLADLRGKGRSRVLASRGSRTVGAKAGPSPFSCWTFDEDARDSVGALHGELMGRAVVRNGRLRLNGEDAFVRTSALTKSITARTLEAWVALDNTTQRGGGVITIETEKGNVFDAIVFGEKKPGEWLAGSDNFRRTRDAGGAPEEATREELVHVAIVYDEGGGVSVYRNGEPYGKPYVTSDEVQTFAANSAHVLLGKRHLGGGNSFLAGEIEEARLYDRPLSSTEVQASFMAGTGAVREEELLLALSPEEKAEYQRLQETLRAAPAPASPAKIAGYMEEALAEAEKHPEHPLHPWVKLRARTGQSFQRTWDTLAKGWAGRLQEAREFNRENFTVLWDLTGGDYSKWFKEGNGLPRTPSRPGEFFIEPEGDSVLRTILPAGVYSPLLSNKHAALLVSPFFKMETDAMSVQLAGEAGGGVRVIVDNYPLGNNGTYPQYRPNTTELRWVKMDTTYRKGSRAYVELSTRDDSTRPQPPSEEPRAKAKKPEVSDGRSWFGVTSIVLHNRPDTGPPRALLAGVSELLKGAAPTDADALAARIGHLLAQAVEAWRDGALTEDQQAWLDVFVRHNLLPVDLASMPEVATLTRHYRELESSIPLPRRAPGPMEGDGYDATLMPRGNHLLHGEVVPRHFLSALGAQDCKEEAGSGRLGLARAMTGDGNPLFSRVMVNRIWHWLFGKGLVGTVDNFGRLGDRPTHPELLDYLAIKFRGEGWSVKKMVRFMVLSQTWQMSSDATEEALRLDAGNQWFSRARVQRLQAEMIRDGMLQVSGALVPAMYGEPVGDVQRRRSIYLVERRNGPHPFLEVFDRPKPMTTRGQRDATNIPAQSLTLMNGRFVTDLSLIWARRVVQAPASGGLEARIQHVYEAALGRPATAEEVQIAREYFGGQESEDAWKDYLQAVFALKEFIYLR